MTRKGRRNTLKKVLFVCSQNKLRSPTAEATFKGTPGFEVSSAGLNHDAIHPISSDDLEWADVIFVMEKRQGNKLRKKFKEFLKEKRIVCLDILDIYDYMEQPLIDQLKTKLDKFFGL